MKECHASLSNNQYILNSQVTSAAGLGLDSSGLLPVSLASPWPEQGAVVDTNSRIAIAAQYCILVTGVCPAWCTVPHVQMQPS